MRNAGLSEAGQNLLQIKLGLSDTYLQTVRDIISSQTDPKNIAKSLELQFPQMNLDEWSTKLIEIALESDRDFSKKVSSYVDSLVRWCIISTSHSFQNIRRSHSHQQAKLCSKMCSVVCSKSRKWNTKPACTFPKLGSKMLLCSKSPFPRTNLNSFPIQSSLPSPTDFPKFKILCMKIHQEHQL